MEDKDGGQAFPRNYAYQNPEAGQSELKSIPGMTLRDYFAAAALTGIMLADEKARQEIGGDRRYSTANEFAHAAYQQADAMLQAR